MLILVVEAILLCIMFSVMVYIMSQEPFSFCRSDNFQFVLGRNIIILRLYE